MVGPLVDARVVRDSEGVTVDGSGTALGGGAGDSDIRIGSSTVSPKTVGVCVVTDVGPLDGEDDVTFVGEDDGTEVRDFVGYVEGDVIGILVGTKVGVIVGCRVGDK